MEVWVLLEQPEWVFSQATLRLVKPCSMEQPEIWHLRFKK